MIGPQYLHRTFQLRPAPGLGMTHLKENIVLQLLHHQLVVIPEPADGFLHLGFFGEPKAGEGEEPTAQHGMNQLHIWISGKKSAEQLPADSRGLIHAAAVAAAQVGIGSQAAVLYGQGRMMHIAGDIALVQVFEERCKSFIIQIQIAVVGG